MMHAKFSIRAGDETFLKNHAAYGSRKSRVKQRLSATDTLFFYNTESVLLTRVQFSIRLCNAN